MIQRQWLGGDGTAGLGYWTHEPNESLPLAQLERPIPWASPRRATSIHTYIVGHRWFDEIIPTLRKYRALHQRAKTLVPPGPNKQLALYTGRKREEANFVYDKSHLCTLTSSCWKNSLEASLYRFFFKVHPPWGGARGFRGRITCGHCPHPELGRDYLDHACI